MNKGKELETAFEKLLGDTTDEERQKIYRVKDALGLQNHDALWMVLFALQYHHRLYEQVPAKIEAASLEASKAAAYRAQGKITEAVAGMVPAVQAGVEKAATQALRQVNIEKSLITLISAAALAVLLMLSGIVLGVRLLSTVPDALHIGLIAGSWLGVAMLALMSIAFAYVRDKETGGMTTALVVLAAVPLIVHALSLLWVGLSGIWRMLSVLL